VPGEGTGDSTVGEMKRRSAQFENLQNRAPAKKALGEKNKCGGGVILAEKKANLTFLYGILIMGTKKMRVKEGRRWKRG